MAPEEAIRRKPKFTSFNILAMDGGGVRGVLEGTIVQRLEYLHKGFIRDIDMLVGASTGAIQALSLAAGHPPEKSVDMYERGAKFIFEDSFADDVRDVWRLFGADYSNENMRNLLTMEFGDMTLGDLDKRVAIIAFDLDNDMESYKSRSWQPKVFHNMGSNTASRNEKVVDVALRSSAAPLIFPTVDGYIDGGLVANNPAMVGLSLALDAKTGPAREFSEIKLLSLGTGRCTKYIEGNNLDWGLASWAPHLLDMLMDAQGQAVDFQCRQILKDKYFRINPKLGVEYAIDDWKAVPELAEVASQFELTAALQWLEKNWR